MKRSTAALRAGAATGSNASGSLQFRFTQAGATTTGTFDKFTVSLTTAADGTPTRLAVVIDAASLNTKDKDRDSALRTADLFERAEGFRRQAIRGTPASSASRTIATRLQASSRFATWPAK